MLLWNRSSLPFVCEWYGLELISPMPLSRSSLSNTVGCQDLFGSFLRTPTKQDPLSESTVAGVPNLLIACRSTATAFSDVVYVNRVAPVTHLEASSRNVIKLSPLKRGSFIMCQPVCHMELECLLS